MLKHDKLISAREFQIVSDFGQIELNFVNSNLPGPKWNRCEKLQSEKDVK